MIADRGLAHIDQVDDYLQTWASGVLDGAEVIIGAPTDSGNDAVNIHLLEIRPRQPTRGRVPAPLMLWLRYLVSAWSEPLADSHRRLGSLAFGVLDNEDLEFDPLVPPGTWRDLGIAPRAAFVLGIELVRHRQVPSAPLVEHPLEVQDSRLLTMIGNVTTRAGQPVPGVVLEMVGSSRRVVTDGDGTFTLHHSVKQGGQRLRLVAKGRSCEVTLTEREATGEPLDFGAFELLLAFRTQS